MRRINFARLKVQETGEETDSSPPQTGGLCSTPDFAAAARGKNLYFVNERLQKSAELLDSQSRVARDTAHCEGIHGIVTRDHEDARAIVTMCLPWRAMWNPAFSNARTASR